MIILRDNEKLTRQQLEALINQIKAIVYARVSSDGQVDNYSIESQIEMCVKDAEVKLALDKDEILVLVEEAESGDNPNRPMLNYLLFLFGKGIGKKVIILHPNRLSRYLHLQQNIAHQIWEQGCDLHFVEFDFDKDSPESMFMFNIQGSVAQYNKAKILADTKRGRKTMVSNGKIPGMNRVYGYTFDKDLDILVENTEEKAVYLKMVSMIIDKDMTCSEVARILSKRHNAPKGNKWYQATVSRILRNPLYMGNYFYGKTEILQSKGKKTIIKKPREEWSAIPIPAYVDEITFNKLQMKLDALSKNNKKSGRPSEDYLLKGLARCGRCAASVSSGITSKTKGGLIKYYSCTRKSKKSYEVGTGKHNEVCRGRNWRVDKIDDKVWSFVKNFIQNPEKLLAKIVERNNDDEHVVELNKKKNLLEKDLKEKSFAVERYLDLYASGFIKTKQALEEKIGNLQEQVEEIERDILIINENLMYASVENDKVKQISHAVLKYQKIVTSDDISSEDKKSLINIFIEKVVLGETTIEPILKIDKIVNGEPENGLAHKNLISRQSDGLSFYVSDELNILPTDEQRKQEALRKYDLNLTTRTDELMHLYTDELMTFEEISNTVSCNWWTIKNLFKDLGIEFITIKERAKLKRKKHLPQILDMHYNKRMTLADIYREHKLSPQYIRQALTENGYGVINYQKCGRE